ncbi:unnamed protein product [Meganyctiphanes norvegica]|uniref:Alpha-1,3-mannosyl-glycoprotein 2-beta-N-acetylglucosaminyltransferase n=1 Tax=Meganyctiphanes norvegica TaxID=48144 RepID=A0AAV2QFJ1_MEGNR
MLSLCVICFFIQIASSNSNSGIQVNHSQRFSVSVSSMKNGWSLQMNVCSIKGCSQMFKYEDNSLTSSPKKQGLVLNIFNQNSGKSIFQKTFLLGKYWAYWSDLEWHIKRTAPGRIVAMTIAVTGAVGLRNASVTLNHLGSSFATHLTSFSQWNWVFIKGGRTIMESVVLGGRADNYAHGEHYLNFNAPSATSVVELQRWNYCQDYGAMGGLCDTYNPDPLPVSNPLSLTINPHALDNVPIIVTAGTRHQYLYHSITNLLKAPGVVRNNILLVLGDTSPAMVQLIELLDLKYTKLPMKSDVSTKKTFGIENIKLFNYYKHVFELVLKMFSNAPAVIFLDEDVEVSPDFFSYMSQTLWLLETDESLYCINGFSQLGLDGLAHNSARINRGEMQIEWGYAITLKFIKEVLELWKSNSKAQDTALYDFWIYRHASNGRECIFPEVSRTRHYGVGVNAVVDVVENVFLRMKLVTESQVPLQNVTRLQLSHWRPDIIQSIKNSETIRGNPCSPDFLPLSSTSPKRNSNTKIYSFFYRLDRNSDGYPDYVQYFLTMACFGTWSQSEQGHHDGITIISPRVNTLLYIIGVPFSSYSYLKPNNIPLWDIDTVDEKVFQFNAKRMAIINHANWVWPNITSTDDMIRILSS